MESLVNPGVHLVSLPKNICDVWHAFRKLISFLGSPESFLCNLSIFLVSDVEKNENECGQQPRSFNLGGVS